MPNENLGFLVQKAEKSFPPPLASTVFLLTCHSVLFLLVNVVKVLTGSQVAHPMTWHSQPCPVLHPHSGPCHRVECSSSHLDRRRGGVWVRGWAMVCGEQRTCPSETGSWWAWTGGELKLQVPGTYCTVPSENT